MGEGEVIRGRLVDLYRRTEAARCEFTIGTSGRETLGALCDYIEAEIDRIEANYNLERLEEF